ncbi:MAG: aspartyl protease family protein [Candidatus Zixiibacteriota bacterium]
MRTERLVRHSLRGPESTSSHHDSLGKRARSCRGKARPIILFISLLLLIPAYAKGQSIKENLVKADKLFEEGKFAEAKAVYADVAKTDPDNYQAVLSLGRINLYENSLKESEEWLKKAIELNPEEKEPKALLAEACYRQDNFREAAPLFRAIDRIPRADKFEYFAEKVPYQIESGVDVTSVEFVQTDPLPVVKMRINNSEEVLFLIDTGGWELIIEDEFAKEVDAMRFGGQEGTFAGGKKATHFEGTVDQVQIGDFTVRNVPVSISERSGAMFAMFGMPIRGIIGTVFLYHFIFTLDYPDGKLILQRKTKENIGKVKKHLEAKKSIVVPFWMAGDHFMVAWGTVNGSKPLLWFVDTGLAGGGFLGSDRTVKEAGIQLPEESFEGEGGGGKVSVKPAMVDELTLGDAKEKNVMGIFGAFGSTGIEYEFGFRIGGIISHGFFRPYKLTFDFTTMNLILERTEG